MSEEEKVACWKLGKLVFDKTGKKFSLPVVEFQVYLQAGVDMEYFSIAELEPKP